MADDPKTLEWHEITHEAQAAVIREMLSNMARHFVAFKQSQDVMLASGATGYRDPLTTRVTEHSAQIAGGYHAAIRLLERLADGEKP